MSNYIVNWTDGNSQMENYLVVATSFASSADIVWSKKSNQGYITAIYSTTLSIDKVMGPNVYYIIMNDGSKFFITSSTWTDAKDWVYQALGTDVNTIMYLGMVYLF